MRAQARMAYSRFRNHRQVDGNAVALFDVAVAQHVGEAANLVVQFPIGDFLRVLGIIAFPDDRDLVAAGVEVTVDAIVGRVGRAVLEPFDRNVMRIERSVFDLGKVSVPVNALGFFSPECVRVPDRALVHRVVFCVVDVGALGPRGGNIVNLVRHYILHAHGARTRSLIRPLLSPLSLRTSGRSRPGRPNCRID